MKSQPPHIAINVLKWSVFLLLLGRAYQCFFWDFPLRAFFWEEGTLGAIVEGISGQSWAEVMNAGQYDRMIMGLQTVLGALFLLAACASLSVEKLSHRLGLLLPTSSVLLVILALLIWKEKSYQIPQFFELSIQIAGPWLLWQLMKTEPNYQRLFNGAIAVTITAFVAHGLYALNIYPTPGKFVDMSIRILGFSEEQSYDFLLIMGVLDLLLIPALLFQSSRKIALIYAISWGFLTAFARVVAYWEWQNWPYVLHENAYLTVYRLIHGGLPLFLFLWLSYKPQKKGA